KGKQRAPLMIPEANGAMTALPLALFAFERAYHLAHRPPNPVLVLNTLRWRTRFEGVTSVHDIFDRRLLTRRRNRAAPNASAHAFLLERVAEDFLERLGGINRTFPVVLNLGAHHGVVGRRLGSVAGVEMVIDTDPAAQLLAQCDGLRVQADEEL